MQPLTQRQMQQFVREYLPENGEEMLRQLGGRLQELGETPLFLWMLCEVFDDTKQIPTSLGLLFRGFSAAYDKLKQDIPISEGLRNWQSELLQHLAFVMMQGDSSTELRLTIPKQQAWTVLTDFLQGKVAHPDDCARGWLEDLLKYHLIQLRTDEQIEFRHQLLQEYYAGERREFCSYVVRSRHKISISIVTETCSKSRQYVEDACKAQSRCDQVSPTHQSCIAKYLIFTA